MSVPFSFQWHITDECDQRCRHCYIYAEDPGRKARRMSMEDMRRVLLNCLDFCNVYAYDPVFYITGGDPILHPDFRSLLDELHRLGIPFIILGNPFHLSVPVCRRLKKLGCLRYQVSIDGTEETHDAMRKKGSYRKTIEAISILRRAGLESAVMMTVSGINLSELPDVIDAAVLAGADHFSFARYCPSAGEGTNGITPAAYREMLKVCREKILAHIASGCRTRFDKKDHLWTLLDYEEGRFSISDDAVPGVIYDGCHCGRSHLTILPDGSIYACRRVPDSILGNALTDRLRNIWSGPINQYRQYNRFEKCAACPLLSFCRGCPAVAASSKGSFYAADPQCWRM